MAGKALRSRCILPSVAESKKADLATFDVCPKSKQGRAQLHQQTRNVEALVGQAVGGSALGTIRVEAVGQERVDGQSGSTKSNVGHERKWQLERCTLQRGDEAMKGPHTRKQVQVPVPLSSSSRSTDSGTSEESEDEVQVRLPGDQDSGSMDEGELTKSKGKKKVTNKKTEEQAVDQGARLVVDNDHVATLVREYRKHFMDFSKGRKKKTKQLIPNKVWTKVYSNYKKQFPRSGFRPESLKIHLREALTEMQSRVNNPEADNQEGAELQNSEEMRELYNTEGFLRRNVLQVRQRSMEGSVSKKRKEPLDSAPPANDGTPIRPSPHAEKSNISSKPFTKKEVLKQAGEDIASMLFEVKSIKEKKTEGFVASKEDEKRALLIEARCVEATAKREEAAARREEAAARHKESTARCEETHSRKVFQDKQNILAEIGLLEKQRDIGTITLDEFKEKCRLVFGT